MCLCVCLYVCPFISRFVRPINFTAEACIPENSKEVQSSGDPQGIFINSALLPPEVHTVWCIERGLLLTVTPPKNIQNR